MLSAYTGNPWFEAYAMRVEKQEDITMLAVMQRAEEKVKNLGRKEGRKERQRDINHVYASLFEQGRGADVQRSVVDPEYLKQILREFGIPDADDDELEASPS